jgi:hypothetical protein
MLRGLTAVSLVTLLGLCFTAAAIAGGPTRTPLDNEEFTVEGVCPFPVTLTPRAGGEILKEFSNGRAMVNGRLVARVTNDDTGASIAVNVSGPATFVFRGDSVGVRTRGRGLLFFFPGELGPGSDGALLLVSGLAVQIFDSDGLTIVRLPHHRRDLCRALA